ncbi:MAG: hypothetical protein IJD30_05665 [Clostridia bacterium]|nr:hypothetical protein [Clostridia bacterium]
MFKKLILACLLAMTVSAVIPTCSFAAFSNSISLSEQGTSSDIIYIKRPESHQASTSDRTYTISAVGSQGTVIKIYKYNPADDMCHIIKAGTSIGASGLYSVVVDLTDNSNTFMVTAENSQGSQAVRIDINKIKQSTIDRLRNVTVTIRNLW